MRFNNLGGLRRKFDKDIDVRIKKQAKFTEGHRCLCGNRMICWKILG